MGLLSVGIGPDAQRDMTKIEPEMLLAIHYATETIQAGNFDSKLWFGDCSSGWINGLKKTLTTMASLINLETIKITAPPLNTYQNLYAQAMPPRDDWQNFTKNTNKCAFLTNSQNQSFCIRLCPEWHTALLFRYRHGPITDTKFQIIAHELTHLLLHTEDISFGMQNCASLALSKSIEAKSNADNWGDFIEEFSTPGQM